MFDAWSIWFVYADGMHSCLTDAFDSKRTPFKGSDIDLFFYDLTDNQADEKVEHIRITVEFDILLV